MITAKCSPVKFNCSNKIKAVRTRWHYRFDGTLDSYTRLACILEAGFSVLAFGFILNSVLTGRLLNFMPLPLLALNIVGAGLVNRGISHSNTALLLPYIIWKTLQEIVTIPALILVTLIDHTGYLRTWENHSQAQIVLVIGWFYAISSMMVLILVVASHRRFWIYQCETEKEEMMRLHRRMSTLSAWSLPAFDNNNHEAGSMLILSSSVNNNHEAGSMLILSSSINNNDEALKCDSKMSRSASMIERTTSRTRPLRIG